MSAVALAGRPARLSIAPEILPLIRLALPLVMAMVGQIAITTTDLLMLGRLGPDALAATALGLSLFHPLLLLGVGIGLAVTPLVSEALTAYRGRQVRRTVRQGIWAAVPFTLLCAPVFWWSSGLFTGIGQDAALSATAQLYLRAVLPGLLFALIFNALRAYMTALEVTRAVMLVSLIAVPLNAAFNYVLIFGALGLPALGVLGAGIGSSLTNLVMALALAWHCARHRPFRRHAIFGRFWRPDWVTFWRVHRIGVPIGLMIVLEVALFAGSSQILGLIGTLQLAAHQIALQIASIAFMVPLGIGQAATARVGLAFGRDGPVQAAGVGWAALLLSSLFMAMTALAFWLIPDVLSSPFLDGGGDSLRVAAFAASYLAVAAAFQLVDGIQVVAAHALRGLRDTLVPMWIALVGYWMVGMPVAVYLGLYTPLAGVGVWLGLLAGLTVCGAALTYRFWRLTRLPQAIVDRGMSIRGG